MKRYKSIDIIRGICMIIMLAGHMLNWWLIPKDQFDKIIRTQFKNSIVNENYISVQNDGTRHTPSVMSSISNPFTNYFSESDFISTVTFTPTTGQSIYDLQSNGSNVQLWQNPANPDQVHAVYMTACTW